jgi:hypothetical protein
MSTRDQTLYEITVDAGDIDRTNTVVSFGVPNTIPPGTYGVYDDENNRTVLQVDRHRVGWMVIDSLPKHGMRRYTLSSADTVSCFKNDVKKMIDSLKVTFFNFENEILSYYHTERPLPEGVESVYARAGYIHPVRTPDGVIVTQDFAEVHPHHHGIWSAWTKVEFQGRETDFWNVGKGMGAVISESLEETWTGPVHSGLQARHRYVDITTSDSITALHEEWVVRVYNVYNEYTMFDMVITQTAATPDPVVLPEYEYGGVGFRGHEDWEGEERAFFITSEGRTRSDGHRTRARWCHIGGYTGDRLAGITILDHPHNIRHPQPMHIHQTRTFFNYAVVQLGELRIEPGIPYSMRYRYIAWDGKPDPGEINRLWLDYAYLPAVSITLKNKSD